MSNPTTSRDDIMVARRHLNKWIADERAEYADTKYDFEGEPFRRLVLDMQNFGLVGGEWEVFLGNYKRRAELLGLETTNGRQAFGKFIVTCMAALEHAICIYGNMPEPGVSSGEIREWPPKDITRGP